MKIKERFACLALICIFVTMGQVAFARVASRYLYFGVGTANVSYSEESEVERLVDSLGDSSDSSLSLGGSSDITLTVDLLGFYYSLSNHKTMLGGIANGVGEQYKTSGQTIGIIQYLLSFSAMHFFGKEIGRGPFLRGDLGFAGLIWRTSGARSDEEIGFRWEEGTESSTGIGFLLGAGYAIPVKGTNVLLNLNYATRFIAGERHGTLSVGVGGFVY